MLKTDQVTFNYSNGKTFSFNNIESSSEPLLILGPSGCGKTTLLHLLAGILKPNSGNIYWADVNINQLMDYQIDRFRGKKIGLIFQKPHFVNALNVEENIKLQASINKKDVLESDFEALIDRLNIKHLLAKNTKELSEGEKQRVSIARALVAKPAYILADEPTSALDDKNTEEVLNLLVQESKHGGAQIVIITHDQRLKDKITNQIELV
jgi:ABC-type lipoprotein export system ATPase subunit